MQVEPRFIGGNDLGGEIKAGSRPPNEPGSIRTLLTKKGYKLIESFIFCVK